MTNPLQDVLDEAGVTWEAHHSGNVPDDILDHIDGADMLLRVGWYVMAFAGGDHDCLLATLYVETATDADGDDVSAELARTVAEALGALS